MGPTGDATLPLLLADSEATLGETGGALDAAIEQIALWVGQQLHDTQSSLTAIKAKLTKWANKALQTTGATLNDVVAILQQNAAAYVDPQQTVPPSGVSSAFGTPYPSGAAAVNPAPSSLTDITPAQQSSDCGLVAYTAAGDTNPPFYDPLPGYHWVFNGIAQNGMNQWVCQANTSYAQPVGGGGGGSLLQGSGINAWGIPGNTCRYWKRDGSCASYPDSCISPSPFAPYTDWEELYFTDPTVNGVYNNTSGFYSATFAASSVGGQCRAAAGGGQPVPAVTAPLPCELPPDVASWPGQRVVNIPFDLNQGGEASAWGECGQLMIRDALGARIPTQLILDALVQPDPIRFMFPEYFGWANNWPDKE